MILNSKNKCDMAPCGVGAGCARSELLQLSIIEYGALSKVRWEGELNSLYQTF